jgi:signal transduction histidine kinase
MSRPKPAGRLRSGLRRLLSVRVEDHPDSFEDYARALTLGYFRLGFVLFAGSALLWWPTDLFLLPPEAQRVFALSRPTTASLGLLGIASTFWLRRHLRWVFPAVTAYAFALCGTAGAFKGLLGGLDEIYFHYAYLLPFIGVLVVAPLAKRMVLTAIVAAGYPAGFLAANPAELSHPMLGSALGYLAFGVLLACGIGHGVYLLIRANFEQRATLELRIADRTEILRRLTAYLEESREQERRRVSRELHDETAQLLTGMRLELAMIRDLAGRNRTLAPSLERLETLIDESFAAHRAIIRSLRPRILEQLGLIAAVRDYLERFEQRFGAAVEVDVDESLPPLDERIALAAFRTVQELTTNVLRHAGARVVTVRVHAAEGALRLEVADDGRGFDPEAVDGGFGLLGMRERVRGLGGTLAIEAAEGAGCRAVVRLPLAASRNPAATESAATDSAAE